MADMDTTLDLIPSARRKALVIPREHGAWGMLLVPLATGAAVGFLFGRNVTSFLLLLTVSLALFWLRTPAESLLGTSPMKAQTVPERWLATKFVLILATVALVAST